MQYDKPYLLSREDWSRAIELNTPDGMPRYNSNGAGRSGSLSKIENKIKLLFNVHKWLYDKAMLGDEEAAECVETGIYDKYEMIIKKAKEQKLIP